MEEEIWKPVFDFEDHYEVSNLGNLRSIKFNKIKNLTLNRKNKGGYYYTNLYKNGICKTLFIHRIVAISFIQNEISKEENVDHINNDKTDNRLINLQIISKRENNSKDRKSNTGFTGVHWHKLHEKFIAQISINKNQICLGYFDDMNIAKIHYDIAFDIMDVYDNNINFIKLVKNKYNESINKY